MWNFSLSSSAASASDLDWPTIFQITDEQGTSRILPPELDSHYEKVVLEAENTLFFSVQID